MSLLNHHALWGVGVVYPQSSASVLNITVSDSEGCEMGIAHPMFRGMFTERLRMDDKVAQGVINGKRALKRKNLRRARYWINVAQHWLDRRREIFNIPSTA